MAHGELFELPDDLRAEVLRVAAQKQISVEWLVRLYQRGARVAVGATGRFPEGRMSREDEGELAMAIATDAQNGVVRMEFGKMVGWLAMPASHARHLAKVLVEKADELERKLP